MGSPLPPSLTAEQLVALGKRMKKNNVAIDVVSFGGESEENAERLRKFVEAVDSGNNSHLVDIPVGAGGLLGDHIASSPVLAEELPGAGAAIPGAERGAAGGGMDGFGVDPNLDPELAMVRPTVAASFRVEIFLRIGRLILVLF